MSGKVPKEITKCRLNEYNHGQPYRALNNLTPATWADLGLLIKKVIFAMSAFGTQLPFK